MLACVGGGERTTAAEREGRVIQEVTHEAEEVLWGHIGNCLTCCKKVFGGILRAKSYGGYTGF